jgi:PAS domain S-box-containing protein
MPSDALRILILEDMPMDAELLEYELRRANVAFVGRCVDTRDAFVDALEDFRPDVILSDYTVPRFDGMAALAVAKERAPATPLLIVTGSVNEETAVGCMKAGAADYVLKGNLSRIGPAIEAALARARAQESQRRAEAALRRSEANLRAIFNNSLQCFVLVDRDGTIQALNRTAAEWGLRILGREPTEGAPIATFIPGTAEAFAAAIGGSPRTAEHCVTDSEGQQRWFETSSVPVVDDEGGVIGVCLSAVNIDERRRSAEAVLTSERRFRSLVQNSSDLVVVVGEANRILYASDSAERILGRRPSELVGASMRLLLTDDAMAELTAALADLSSPGTRPFELTIVRPTGEAICLEAVATDLRADPVIGGIVLNARDVSERKTAERALRESEERYRDLFDNASDLVCMTAADGSFAYVNRAWEHATGYSGSELARKSLLELVHPDSRATLAGSLDRVLEGEAVSHLEVVLLPRHGEPLTLEGSASRMSRDGRVTLIRGIFRDVGERRKVEDHLRRAERMQAAGRLAGGVAHEVNNMMTGVIGFASLLRKSLPEEDVRQTDVREIVRAAERAADLTRQLLAFTRQQVRRVEVLDLNDVVGGLERMLRRSLGDEHELVLRLRPSARVAADRSQLEQVLVNLVLNARDAMDVRGRVTIETAAVELTSAYATRHAEVRIPPGRYVMLALSDTGCGMSADVQARIFEPFFTTKPVGRGTGLGLSTVYGIVKQSDGFVWAYSELGKGSVFKVYLPQSEAAAGRSDEDTGVAATQSRGNERVLVVEDEALVRSLACRSLREEGYAVAEAANGLEALEYVRGHGGQVDIVVSDVVMPEMGGRELGRHLAALQPRPAVLYISGFTSDDVVDRGLLDPGSPFLQKPFAPGALSAKVRELLDRSQATP